MKRKARDLSRIKARRKFRQRLTAVGESFARAGQSLRRLRQSLRRLRQSFEDLRKSLDKDWKKFGQSSEGDRSCYYMDK